MRYDYEVVLTPYSDVWKYVRNSHCAWIHAILSGIEHEIHDIGSRLVPNVPSKNIIDLLLIVPSGVELFAMQQISSVGLETIDVPEVSPIPMLRLRDDSRNPILHLHIGDTMDRPDVRFHRKIMCDNELAYTYGKMKLEAQVAACGNVRTYNLLKTKFFNSIAH